MNPEVQVVVGDERRVSFLEEIFLSMHHAHREVSPIGLTEPDELAWRERQATYASFFATGRAHLLVAEVAGRPVGYALAVERDSSNDTFPLGPTAAELYTLAVLPAHRGQGVATALLDALDERLAGRAITNLTVAVLAGNERALRFYARRGLVAGEVVLYRVAAPYGRPPSSTP